MNRRVRDPYATEGSARGTRWCERRTPVGNYRSRLLDYEKNLYDFNFS
jgi:hypothetical protein